METTEPQRKPGRNKLVYDKTKRTIVSVVSAVAEGSQAPRALNITGGMEMETKHTPLPWIREQFQDGELLPDGTGYAGDMIDSNEIINVDSDGAETWVATTSNGHNAAFIVRACNSHYQLLKAAQRALNTFKAQGESVRPGNVLDALQSAIAGATP